jgi:DNA replication protein DnaC
VLSVDEVLSIIEQVDLTEPEGARNRAILEMLYSCGLRVSELVNLKLSDLFLDDGFIRIIGKGNKQRLVPIGEYAINAVENYRPVRWAVLQHAKTIGGSGGKHTSGRPGSNRLSAPKTGKGVDEDTLFLNRRGGKLTREMVFNIVKKYAEEFDPAGSGSIIMLGNTGLGKTHLSSAMGGVIIGKGNDVYYSSAVDMFADFEDDRFHSSYQESGGQIDKYFSCDLLIIDDLGTEMVNQFTASCLYNVINSRLIKKKPTIINTNFTRDEMRKKYMDRITSRIFGEYMVLPFVGNDIREQKLRK